MRRVANHSCELRVRSAVWDGRSVAEVPNCSVGAAANNGATGLRITAVSCGFAAVLARSVAEVPNCSVGEVPNNGGDGVANHSCDQASECHTIGYKPG